MPTVKTALVGASFSGREFFELCAGEKVCYGEDAEQIAHCHRTQHTPMPRRKVSGEGRQQKMRRGLRRLATAVVALGTGRQDTG